MLRPEFPYKGNQVIISSGRVLLHAKSDAVFIFGKQGVGISTPKTFNVDAPERTIINSDIIELGLRAKTEGEPVLKANTTITQLNRLMVQLQAVGDALEKIAVEGLPASVPAIKIAGGALRDTAKSVAGQLNTSARSTTTFTK